MSASEWAGLAIGGFFVLSAIATLIVRIESRFTRVEMKLEEIKRECARCRQT